MPHAVDTSRSYAEFIVERPMVGYGLTPPKVEWPNKGKIAVSFVIEYTEGGEYTLDNGDAHSDSLFMDLGVYAQRPARDDMLESEFEFGPRAGLPRILSIFERHDVNSTVNVVSSAIEKAPYWAKKLGALSASKKVELSCGGKRWIDYFDVDPEEEEKHIVEAIEAVQKITGSADSPKGFYIGRRSNVSQRLYVRAAKEAGISGVYSSDSFSDDLPYWTVSPLVEEGGEDEGMLVVPYSHDCSDWRFNATAVGWSSGKDWLRHLTDTFDTLYEEGEEGEAKMMTVSIHPRIAGRAGRAAFLEEFIKYIKSKDGVWIAKREEIAQFWREQHPYDAATAHGQLPKK